MVSGAHRGLSERFREATSGERFNENFAAGDESLSYGELGQRVRRTCNLFESTGLEAGDRIVVACADDIETAVLYISALRFGLCTAVIDPMSSVPEAILLINAVDPKAVFIDYELARETLIAAPETAAKVFTTSEPRPRTQGGAVPGLITLKKNAPPTVGQDFREARGRHSVDYDSAPVLEEDATALVLFTSGTTSRPKGVELTFGNLRAQFETFERQYGFDAESRILNHLPLHHTDGLNQGPAIALFCGGTWIRPRGPVAQRLDDFLSMVGRESVTHIITVPTVLALIDQLPRAYDEAFDSESFAFIVSTAGYLDETLWRRFESRFGVRVVNSYGLTETVSESLYCGPDERTRRVGSVGRPVDCEAKVVGSDGEPVPTGTTGELILRGANVLKGYLNDTDATDAVLRDGWFFTEDLAQEDKDGFFYIVGRKKNLIIRAGINVYPDDVTNCVMELDEVLEASTLAIADSILGEKVVICVTPTESEEGLVDAVTSYCKRQLAPERRPDHVLVVGSLPRGPSGKVVLDDLRDVVSRQLGKPLVATDGNIEEQVIAISASVLGVPVDSITTETSSASLESWDSLAHLALISALEKQFSLAFQAEDIMNITNIESAISLVSAKSEA